MKKKLLAITVAVMVSLAMVGCSRDIYEQPIELHRNKRFTEYYIDDYVRYRYLVDNQTGVVYLKYSSDGACGITAMLNADGTPMTAVELGIGLEEITEANDGDD